MTNDVVLDANVLVGFMDPSDSCHLRAKALLEEIERAGKRVVLIDFLVEEALAVVVRRARERRQNPSSAQDVCMHVRTWYESGRIESTVRDLEGSLPDVLDIVNESAGRLNPNDAKIVVLQRNTILGEIATFDAALSAFPGVVVFTP